MRPRRCVSAPRHCGSAVVLGAVGALCVGPGGGALAVWTASPRRRCLLRQPAAGSRLLCGELFTMDSVGFTSSHTTPVIGSGQSRLLTRPPAPFALAVASAVASPCRTCQVAWWLVARRRCCCGARSRGWACSVGAAVGPAVHVSGSALVVLSRCPVVACSSSPPLWCMYPRTARLGGRLVPLRRSHSAAVSWLIARRRCRSGACGRGQSCSVGVAIGPWPSMSVVTPSWSGRIARRSPARYRRPCGECIGGHASLQTGRVARGRSLAVAAAVVRVAVADLARSASRWACGRRCRWSRSLVAAVCRVALLGGHLLAVVALVVHESLAGPVPLVSRYS